MAETTTVLTSDPDVLGGTRVFSETRVPVRNLLDYLASGETLDDFLEDFPSVAREQALSALEMAREALTAGAGSS